LGIDVLDIVSAKPTSTPIKKIFVSAEQADVASFARLAPIGTAEK